MTGWYMDLDIITFALMHDPRSEYYKLYTSQVCRDHCGQRVKAVLFEFIDGHAVWFAMWGTNSVRCFVVLEACFCILTFIVSAMTPGIWDQNLYQLDNLYCFQLGDLSKKDRIDMGYPMGAHAMLMTGVDVHNDQPRRWKNGNSWGTEGGHSGYYTMNDSWHRAKVFEIEST